MPHLVTFEYLDFYKVARLCNVEDPGDAAEPFSNSKRPFVLLRIVGLPLSQFLPSGCGCGVLLLALPLAGA